MYLVYLKQDWSNIFQLIFHSWEKFIMNSFRMYVNTINGTFSQCIFSQIKDSHPMHKFVNFQGFFKDFPVLPCLKRIIRYAINYYAKRLLSSIKTKCMNVVTWHKGIFAKILIRANLIWQMALQWNLNTLHAWKCALYFSWNELVLL